MKWVYIANARIPTEKAHGIQIMRTCEALTALGEQVELWLPARRNPGFSGRDVFEFYQVKHRFAVRYLWCWDLIGSLDFFPGAGYGIQARTFAWSAARALRKLPQDILVYSRDWHPCQVAAAQKRPYFYEAHTLGEKPKANQLRLLKHAFGVVTITRHLAEEVQKFLPARQIAVAEDGVDLQAFSIELPKTQARQDLGFSPKASVVLYSGHLYDWKGPKTLAYAAEYLPKSATVFLLGGTDQDVKTFKKFLADNHLSRTELLGQVEHSQIPKYLAAADVLVIPNSGKFAISQSHTSPLKLFEYMASRRPIVASDLPSLREILDESRAVFFQPDDPLSLAKKIQELLADPGLGERLAANAVGHVQQYSWEHRAKKIINFVSSRLKMPSVNGA